MSREWINKDNEKFLKVREIVNKYDLEELILMGCPKDEYDPEVTDILNRCNYINDKDKMIERLREIWFYWFVPSFKIDFSNMADELLEVLK